MFQLMARKLRIEFPGAVYHVMNRGDRREAIFRDDTDRESFLRTLADVCRKTDWRILAYCLMENHFHLAVETPRGNLVAGMKWFLGTYTLRFNRRHRLCGHLFSGRYKAFIVDSDSPGYLRTVCEYVHLNPVRAALLPAEEPLRAYRWSSYPAYLKRPRQRPEWLRVEPLMGELGIPRDSAAGRRQFERGMEERRHQYEEGADDWSRIRRSWCWGGETFRKDMLAEVEERRGGSHYGEELEQSAREKAERLVREGLRKLGWAEAELAARRKGDGEKLKLAMKLRAETTMTLKWIAARLAMGTGASLSNFLSEQKRGRR